MLCVLAAAVALATGCKPGAPVHSAPTGYFQTPFQTESKFIVRAIVSDLAQQIYFAAKHQLPDDRYFWVEVTEKGGGDTPLYGVEIDLDKQHPAVKLDVHIDDPIWSPDVYSGVVTAVAAAAGLNPAPANQEGGAEFPSDLLDGTAESIEQENIVLSDSLARSFTSPLLHEQAALLLGAFLLRDHSGQFFEIRSPLCRLTAHLAMAQFLSGSDSFGVNGKLAEAIMLTMVDDEAPSLDVLKSIDSQDSSVTAMIRALQALDTGDFRPLSKISQRSQVESVAWFAATASYVSPAAAWLKLDDSQRQTIDFVRTAIDIGYSVEAAHTLLPESVPLETKEIQDVYQLSHGAKLEQANLVNALNEMPEGCFTVGAGGKIHVRIIGWGQWADFLQRHLCHAVQQSFYALNNMWGVPDDAKKFQDQCDAQFDGLRLYPFVRRFDCMDVASYHKSVDDGFKVTVATPHLVPAQCWSYLCYQTYFAPVYKPNPNPHVNEWHNHNPPPGTVYDILPRLYHPSLISRPDAVARFEQLHAWAPYDTRISSFIVKRKYNDKPTYDEAMGLYHDILPWSVYAMRTVAGTLYNDPDRYERLMLQAAALDTSAYYDLAGFEIQLKKEDKGAQYLDKACDNDPDAVRASNSSEWRVRYYLKKGQTDKARDIADAAAEVYSYAGLEAKAVFMETTSNYDGAFEWYAKMEERYNQSLPLVSFCQRYKALTGDTRFDAELEKRTKILFSAGMEKVSLGDFKSAPTDGVLIQGQNDLLLVAGMKKGDVIVAIGGVRVHNYAQYMFLRDGNSSPELDLIVWQGDGYHERDSSPPNHRFGVDFGDYVPN